MSQPKQLWGGPQHGNIVSSEWDEVYCTVDTRLWLDGPEKDPETIKVEGHYIWDSGRGMYVWDGPGADGDTIERLRLT